MALIINLETATRICSVALASDGIILGLKESNEEKSHANRLTVFIEDLLKEQHLKALHHPLELLVLEQLHLLHLELEQVLEGENVLIVEHLDLQSKR